MRGGAFHNSIVDEVKTVFRHYGWQTYTEYRYCRNGTTTYLDLFAVKGNTKIACEIETTSRHAVDNAAKAMSADIDLWIIVPSRALVRQIRSKLRYSGLVSKHHGIRILLPCQLKAELNAFQEQPS